MQRMCFTGQLLTLYFMYTEMLISQHFRYLTSIRNILSIEHMIISNYSGENPFFYLWTILNVINHDDVIKWKHFPRNWPFVRGIHRPPVNSPHKGQWRGALMFSLIYVWINGWVNNHEAGDLRRYLVHYDVTVMIKKHGMLSSYRRWSKARDE